MSDFNGWSNQQTWAVDTWLTNDEESYNHWIASAAAAGSVEDLAEQLRKYTESAAPDIDDLAAVDWIQIAADFLDLSKT